MNSRTSEYHQSTSEFQDEILSLNDLGDMASYLRRECSNEY
jgi:hypothetical protein